MSSSVTESYSNLLFTSLNAHGILEYGEKARGIIFRSKKLNSISFPYLTVNPIDKTFLQIL